MMKWSAQRKSATDPGDGEQLQAYQQAIEVLIEVFTRITRGDLEARVPQLDGPARLQVLRDAINDAVDVTDAYVREAGASLTAASQGEFHRALLARGLHGAYRDSAGIINTARELMSAASAELVRAGLERQDLIFRVQEIAIQVASASTELVASSAALSDSTGQAVGQTEAARATVSTLEQGSQQIQHALTLVKSIAAQTKLLALNASIEAARAGAAGRGFAVVAGEVQALATEVDRASDDIGRQVGEARAAAVDAVRVIQGIAEMISEMDQQVAGVAAAAGAGLANQMGLSQMAESLNADIDRLAGI